MKNSYSNVNTTNSIEKLISLFEYPLIFSLILTMNTIYFKNVNANYFFLLLVIYGVSAFLVSILSIINLVIKEKNVFPLFIFMIGYIGYFFVFYVINKQQSSMPYSVILTMLVTPILSIVYFYNQISNTGSYRMFFEKFKKIILVLAIVSLFFWLLSLFGVVPNSNYVIDWGGVRSIPAYFKVHFLPQDAVRFLGMKIIRNTGIFVEAPMYSYILSVTLIINIFILHGEKKWENMVIIFTILSTTSSTGLLIIILIFFLYFSRKIKISKELKFLIGIILLLITSTLIYFIIKLKMNDMQGSMLMRLEDLRIGIKAWRLHPFFGNGFADDSVLLQYMSFSRVWWNNTGYSLGMTSLLSKGGLVGLSFYMVPFLLIFRKGKRREFIVYLLLFILFMVTIVNTVQLHMFIMGYLYAELIIPSFKAK
ncbi:hypothetical protein ACEE24_02785 [Latilactobacillus curvatus]